MHEKYFHGFLLLFIGRVSVLLISIAAKRDSKQYRFTWTVGKIVYILVGIQKNIFFPEAIEVREDGAVGNVGLRLAFFSPHHIENE